MKFLKDAHIAIVITIAVIIVSSLYGISKRPIDSSQGVASADTLPTSDLLKEITEEPIVDELYELGKTYYEVGEFKSSIEVLGKVSTDSPVFTEAQTLLLNATANYCSEILALADDYAARQDYKIAIGIIDEALLVVSKDAKLNGAMAEYKTAARAAAIEKAEMCIAEEDYEGAILVIQSAITEVGQNEELDVLYGRYIDTYKNLLISKANEVYHTTGYEDAVSILKMGLQTIGDNAKIISLISEYESCTPTSFYSLTDRNSGYYYDGDPQGNYF